MTLPKLVILDRDNCLCFASSNPESPLYYITQLEQLVIKPGVREALKLIEAHKIPMVLATKQRCIGKGIVSAHMVGVINERLRRTLDVHFEGVYTEENAEDKSALYPIILKDRGVSARDVVLFDDSAREVKIAQGLGIAAYDGADLLGAVKTLLDLS